MKAHKIEAKDNIRCGIECFCCVFCLEFQVWEDGKYSQNITSNPNLGIANGADVGLCAVNEVGTIFNSCYVNG